MLSVREAGDPDFQLPERIKEKVSSCYYITLITQLPYG